MMMTEQHTATLVQSNTTECNSFDSATYKAELLAAIEESRAAIRRGEFFTLEEIEKEIPSWIIG